MNLDELVATAVVGNVTTPVMGENPYEVGADGTPFVPVGAGGICYNVKVGMAAMGWAADQVEPGVSIANTNPAADALPSSPASGTRWPSAPARQRAPLAR